MTITKLANYPNGNCQVQIFSDGTKLRKYENVPIPKFPESIDLKITNRCFEFCKHCHEESTSTGKHADITNIQNLLSCNLPAGVEIAIGGGNPLEHPQLDTLLEWLKNKGFIANITVNAQTLKKHRQIVKKYQQNKLIHGLGISYNSDYENEIAKVANSNTVIHFIAGVDKIQTAIRCVYFKILILGFKSYGKAKTLEYPKENIEQWAKNLKLLFHSSTYVAFDNLALEQLSIRKFIDENKWKQFYMGDDGKFTMYVDAVKMEYAKSSTSVRNAVNKKTLTECFQALNNKVYCEVN